MSRVNFSQIFAKYKMLGKSNVRLTQSSIYLTKPINPNVTTYSFDVLETQTATLQNDELRVNINDEFYLTTLGLYLVAEVKSDEVATLNSQILLTYAPVENSSSLVSVEDFYRGSLQLSVNNVVYLDKWDTAKHKIVPRTQFSNFIALSNAQASIPSTEYSKNAMFPIEPILQISGAKKNTIQVVLPNAISTGTFDVVADDASTLTYTVTKVALLGRGLNAQNGSVFQG
jgi:hypothetical protein